MSTRNCHLWERAEKSVRSGADRCIRCGISLGAARGFQCPVPQEILLAFERREVAKLLVDTDRTEADGIRELLGWNS